MMAPVIRVDDEVQRELEKRAYEMRLVFGTPNQVLRSILGLDGQQEERSTQIMEAATQPTSPMLSPMKENPELSEIPRRRGLGRHLLKEHQLEPSISKGYYDREGGFYQFPKQFPAVLFDSEGYVIFKTAVSMLNSPHIVANTKTEKVNVPNKINSIPEYVRCSHTH